MWWVCYPCLKKKTNTCGNHWYLTCSRRPCAITHCWLMATNEMCCCRSVALLSHRTLTAKGNVWWMVKRFVPPCCLEIYDSSDSVIKTACLGSAVWCDNWRWQKLFWEMLSYLFWLGFIWTLDLMDVNFFLQVLTSIKDDAQGPRWAEQVVTVEPIH